jgi:hypothetical protein
MELELALNHLRELYHERLPPIYYVFAEKFDVLEPAYRADAFLRFLLSGDVNHSDAGWVRDSGILSEAIQTGGSARSFCRIVLAHDPIICFHLDPAIPRLRAESDMLGYPSAQEFGPMP